MPICAKYDVPGTDRGARWYKDLERLVRESMFEIVGEVYASEAQCKLRWTLAFDFAQCAFLLPSSDKGT
eukprot:3907122-Rhodomonas_salina.3